MKQGFYDLSGIHPTPPSPPSSPDCGPPVATFSHVHKYDVDGAFRLDKGVTPAAMRTEGVIKVGLMMEERIFDFDRQCGSHARRSSLYLCLCTSSTLSLFTKRDRVGAQRFRSPFFFFHHLCAGGNPSQAGANLHFFLIQRGLADNPPRASCSALIFSYPSGRTVSGSFHFMCSRLLWFRPVPPRAIWSCQIRRSRHRFVGCKSCYRVISTYTHHYLPSLGSGRLFGQHGFGSYLFLRSVFDVFQCFCAAWWFLWNLLLRLSRSDVETLHLISPSRVLEHLSRLSPDAGSLEIDLSYRHRVVV